ncbi:MAG: transcriptional regulator [Myxococcales bacterium]|nr:transcriptional regulator [Myxococcales bacterium]
MSGRSFGSYCGVARALEVVGERWALLVVRDLLVGPRRFTDLSRGLPKIPSNILSARLKELEQAGVVTRRVLPRPAGSIVYELTDDGRGLEEVVLALGRWGAQRLGERAPDEVVTADSLVMALRTCFVPAAARGLCARWELRCGPIVLHAEVADGALTAGEGAPQGAELVIETTELRGLLAGEVTPAQALADGRVKIAGDPRLLDRFVAVFRIGPR